MFFQGDGEAFEDFPQNIFLGFPAHSGFGFDEKAMGYDRDKQGLDVVRNYKTSSLNGGQSLGGRMKTQGGTRAGPETDIGVAAGGSGQGG